MEISALLKYYYEVIMMLVQTITDDLLSKLRDTGIKEQTIRKNYLCFYRSFCKEAGDKELDKDLIVSFLIYTKGKDLWNLSYYKLNRREQICKHAFNILLEYQMTGQLKVESRKTDVHPAVSGISSRDENKPRIYFSVASDKFFSK